MQADLANEVSAVVDSNAASLNTSQMELVKNQAVAEASASAAKASEEAVRAKKDEIEQDISKYPDEMVTYLELKSDAEIKKTIYTNLVQQCEQNKVQEAMESMDIQVIDAANLPDEKKPSSPKRSSSPSLASQSVASSLSATASSCTSVRIERWKKSPCEYCRLSALFVGAV